MNSSFDIEKIRFPQRQRLTYIESVAYWEGRVDRPRICSAFNVSENHVTKDFRLYKEAFPRNLRYDEKARAYMPMARFKPHIGKGSAEEYLALLRSHAEFGDKTALSLEASSIPVDTAPPIHGKLSSSTLNAVTRAIAAKTGLAISYQSQTRPEPTSRNVWPHALVFGGTRWHVRAWDGLREAFIDLVPQRILSAVPMRDLCPKDSSSDLAWNTWIEIDVVPSKKLSTGQADVVAQQFGMAQEKDGWVWKTRMRQCLAGYFIYLHRLDLKVDPLRLIELRDPTLAARYLSADK